MSTATDALTRKLGPLPVWVWGLGLGVSINVGRWAVEKHKAAGAAVPVAGSDAGTPAGSGPAVTGGAGVVPGVGAPVAGIGIPNPGAWNPPADQVAGQATTKAGPTTNAEWQALVVEALTADGFPPLTSETAISKYLAGQPITVAEQALVSRAFRYSGRPPEGAPTMSTAPDQPSGGNAAPTAPPASPAANTAPVAAPPRIPAAWSPPSWLTGVRFVKGSGPAIYQVIPGQGIEWVPSADAFMAAGGHGPGFDTQPANYVTVADSALHNLPRVGTLPDRSFDPSLP